MKYEFLKKKGLINNKYFLFLVKTFFAQIRIDFFGFFNKYYLFYDF